MSPASQFLSRQLALLSKAIESVSANLSIAAVLGGSLLGLLPHQAGSSLPGRTSDAPAPVELIRAKPVPLADMPAPQVTKVHSPTTILQQVGRRTRDRKVAAHQPESGDLGKAAAPVQAEKAPAPSEKAPVAST